jgi:HSP20 family protein
VLSSWSGIARCRTAGGYLELDAMSSTRWDPWGDVISLQEAMTNLLEESFVRSRLDSLTPAGTLGLAVDLLETPDAFVLTASVPGVKPADVLITVLGDTVTIAGKRLEPRSAQPGAEGTRWLIRERHFGDFDRTVKLPTVVNSEGATAEFEDGVLTVSLPKSEAAKPRTIAVRTVGESADSPPIEVSSKPRTGDRLRPNANERP